MKKIILVTALLIASFTQAQITVTTNGGATINEGQVFTFNTLNSDTSKMDILVTNGTPDDHKFTIRVDEIINNTSYEDDETGASDLQLCFGTDCYPTIYENTKYPNAGLVIPAGQTNNAADHFYNSYAGDVTTEDVEYTFTILQVDDPANPVKIVSFSYVYSTTASISDLAGLQKIGININNTVVTNAIDITTTQNVALQLYNINGQTVKSITIGTGSQSVDLSGLASGVYIARFTNDEKKASQIRIIKN
jgi:hypothetical protein